MFKSLSFLFAFALADSFCPFLPLLAAVRRAAEGRVLGVGGRGGGGGGGVLLVMATDAGGIQV
jgi:hypothetical protein